MINIGASSGDIPAWVQAIGSVIGIGVAVWVPWYQKRREAADRSDDFSRRAKALAFVLRPALEEWVRTLHATLETLALHSDSMKPRQLGLASQRHLKVPDVVLHRVEDLHLLGKSGDHLFAAIALAHEGKQVGERLAAITGVSAYEKEMAELYAELLPKVGIIEATATLALDGVVEIIGAAAIDGTRKELVPKD